MRGALETFSSIVIWSFGGGAILVLLAMVMSAFFAGAFGACVPVFGLFTMMMLARLVAQQRRQRSVSIVGYLEQAARLNLPLGEMLLAAERSECGGTARRLRAIRQAVESGMPVGEALEHYAPEVAGRDYQEISVAERMGQLSAGLSRVHQRSLTRFRLDANEPAGGMGGGYGIVIAVFLLLLLGAVTTFILPKYVEIFDDFDIAMPWATQITFTIGRALGWWGWVAGIGLVMLLAGRALSSISQPRRGVDWSQIPGLDGMLWVVPGARRWIRDRSWAMAYTATADAVGVGYGMAESLRLASASAVTRRVRRQLVHMAQAIDDGGTLASAASLARLPSLSRGMLGALDQGGDAGHTLGFLSRYHASRSNAVLEVLKASVLPLVVITLAVLVGWLVYSLFLPLVHLMYSVMPEWEVL